MAVPNKKPRQEAAAPQSTAFAWPGARANAWLVLSALWFIAGAVGLTLYGEQLGLQWRALVRRGELRSLRNGWEAQAVAGGALAATLFVKTALVLGAQKFGRPLSKATLLIFVPLNAVCEGLGLLAVFDLGRWQLSTLMDVTLPQSWLPASSALAVHGVSGPLFFKEFMLGFAPFMMVFVLLYSVVWEDYILPIHLNLDAPNKFMQAMVMQQFFLAAVYYLTGDLITYLVIRALSDAATVAAARLQPPMARVGPLPEWAYEPEQPAAEAPAGGEKQREPKKER